MLLICLTMRQTADWPLMLDCFTGFTDQFWFALSYVSRLHLLLFLRVSTVRSQPKRNSRPVWPTGFAWSSLMRIGPGWDRLRDPRKIAKEAVMSVQTVSFRKLKPFSILVFSDYLNGGQKTILTLRSKKLSIGPPTGCFVAKSDKSALNLCFRIRKSLHFAQKSLKSKSSFTSKAPLSLMLDSRRSRA